MKNGWKLCKSMIWMILLSVSSATQASWLATSSLQRINASSNHYQPFAHSSRDMSEEKFYHYNMTLAMLGGGYALSVNQARTWYFVPVVEFGTAFEDYLVTETNALSAEEAQLSSYTYHTNYMIALNPEMQYRPSGTDWLLNLGLQMTYHDFTVTKTLPDTNQVAQEEAIQVLGLGWSVGLGYRVIAGLVMGASLGVLYSEDNEIATSALRIQYLFD